MNLFGLPDPSERRVLPTLVPGAKLFIVAEAPGATEVDQGRPLVGASGRLLNGQLARVGISRDDVSVGNVLQQRPPDNKLDEWLVPRTALPKSYSLPAVGTGKYLRPDFLPQVEELISCVNAARPNLVLCLGNLACWALLQQTGITKLRGFIHSSPLLPNIKLLPTFHPAAIFRQHEIWPAFSMDIAKAAREMQDPEFRRPERTICIPETTHDIRDWYSSHEWHVNQPVGLDIETKTFGTTHQITCLGFSHSPQSALVLPIQGPHQGSWWSTPQMELEVWAWVRWMLRKPFRFVLHNGAYDLTYLCHTYGLPPPSSWHDTMILHHAMQPEMRKGLGFLGSLYTNEASWKLMRLDNKGEEKADDD